MSASNFIEICFAVFAWKSNKHTSIYTNFLILTLSKKSRILASLQLNVESSASRVVDQPRRRAADVKDDHIDGLCACHEGGKHHWLQKYKLLI